MAAGLKKSDGLWAYVLLLKIERMFYFTPPFSSSVKGIYLKNFQQIL
jgi:hypothetical protein